MKAGPLSARGPALFYTFIRRVRYSAGGVKSEQGGYSFPLQDMQKLS